MAQFKKIKFLAKNFQLLYSIALIIFIPVAIVANTFIVKTVFEKNIEQESYRNITSIGEAVNANVYNLIDEAKAVNFLGVASTSVSETGLQKQIETIAKFNHDITSLDILAKDDNDDFRVIASLDHSIFGQVSEDMQNIFAWHENRPVAFLTKSSSPNTINQNTDSGTDDDRYRVLTKPLTNERGEKLALLSMKVSLKETDSLSKMALSRSIIVLTITCLIIILLLINNTRLFEYATLYRKLKEVDQMKDEFISMASHELRTPVTGIRGYISMMLDGSFGAISEVVRKNLTLVLGSAERLAILVDDLLNVSRIEQGRMKTNQAPTEITKIIKDILSELKVQSDQKKLALIFKPFAKELPLISIDSDRLKQVLINLVGNSIKYTVKGSVEVIVDAKNNGKSLSIKIKDTGIGMSAKARARLFEKFYRVQDEKTKNITGTGLGLWITKQIVELMAGSIFIDSIEGVGTQVTIEFPVYKK